jgi:hypothetical protein
MRSLAADMATTTCTSPALARAAGAKRHTVSVYRGPAGLRTICAEQSRHAQTIALPRLADFLDWYGAYLDHLAPSPDDVLFCVVAGDAGTASIVPLRKCVWRLAGIRLQSLELPNEWRMPSGDVLVSDGADPAEWLPAVLAELPSLAGGRCDYLRLTNLLAESELAGGLRAARSFAPLQIRISGCCAAPALSEQQLAHWLTKKFRQKLRYIAKRLVAAGASFETATAPADVERAYEEFLEVEAAGWKGAEGSRSALRFDERLGPFYRQFMCRLAARGRAEINLLRLGQRPIAGQCVFSTSDTYYVLKIGYDESFREFSPGVALMEHLFRRAGSAAAAKAVNFTTDMPWMKDWQAASQDVVDLLLLPSTPRGWLAGWYWRAVRAAQFHRRAWVAPLYHRLVGAPAQRYRRRRGRCSAHASE